jgi:hypothetical protein
MCGVKTKGIPVITEVTGTISKLLRQNPSKKAATLGTAHCGKC